MGKLAARALIDQAAHTGPITSGSFNVLIGGKPAARKGDPVTCSSHGVASIVEGSSSVFINGIAAARMGDKTSCGTPPQPAPAGPVGAPVDNNFWSIIPNDKLNSDGTIDHKLEDNLSLKVFEAYANREDKTKDGNYDYGTLGFSVFEMNVKGDYEPLGKGNGGVGGSAGFSKYKGELKGGLYGSNGLYGLEGEGKASMMSGNAEGHIGKEGIWYNKSELKGDIAYIEGKAEAKVFTGGSDNRYGFQGELSGDLGAAKADYEGQSDFLGILKTKAKVGLSGGSAAIGGKAGFYLDTDDYEISANVGGKIAALIGIKADVEVTLSGKPIVNLYTSIKDYFFPPIVEGVILTGCPTVFIG
ncbi:MULTISPECIES: PAAR domain-containing protein [unclassified Chryseobacterium]|uniref:PAAR domain-containing protein n=1 Tax=unclassified Chryseobacterium TaxID=2593645 RepID=UPI00226A256F|nr:MULTISPECIES: PAAR domain-containing protein [unclassified Chryseobacterium]